MRGFRIAAAVALWLGASALQVNETSQCFGIVPELRDDAGVAAETAEMYAAGILAGLPQWLAFDCKLSLRNIVCLSQYGPSVETEPDETFGMCTSVCERVSDKCHAFLEQAGDQLAPFVNLESCVSTPTCTEGNYNVAYEDDTPQCPKPLVVPDRDDPTDPIPGTGCALPCLSFMYTDEEWDNFIATIRFFSFIGLAAGGYMIGVSGYNLYNADEERKVGSFFVFLFSIGCTCSAFGSVILILSGIKEHICYGNATVTGNEDPVCVTQGYLYLFGTMIVIVSGVCQCIDLYLRVVLKESKSTLRWARKLYAGLIAFMLIFPAVTVASVDAIGYESSVCIPSCWIMDDDNDWLSWVVYNVPSTIGHGAIILMMTHCIISMNTVFYQNRHSVITTTDRSSTGQLRGMQKFVRYNIRPLLFIFLVGFIGLFPVGIAYYYEDKTNLMEHGAEKFISCLLTVGATDPAGATAACGEVPEDRPHYKVMIAMVFILCGYGTLPLLIYGIKYPECGALKGWSSTSSPPTGSNTKRGNATSLSAAVPASSASGVSASTSMEMTDLHSKSSNGASSPAVTAKTGTV